MLLFNCLTAELLGRQSLFNISSVFRTQIYWFRIRIHHFRLKTDPDPIQIQGFVGKNLIFFWSKIAIYLSVGLHKGRPSYRRSLQPQKSTSDMKFLNFFLFFWVIFALLDPDQSGSGSETLKLVWRSLPGLREPEGCRWLQRPPHPALAQSR